jgi:hypothetical protein
MGHLSKFLRLSSLEKRILIQVAFLLGAIKLGLMLLPFRTVRRLLHGPGEEPITGPHEGDYQRQVVWATTVAGRYLLGDGACLTQALAVEWLLRRRGIPAYLHMGVLKDEAQRLRAHAWVENNGTVVIGDLGTELSKYKPIAPGDGSWL